MRVIAYANTAAASVHRPVGLAAHITAHAIQSISFDAHYAPYVATQINTVTTAYSKCLQEICLHELDLTAPKIPDRGLIDNAFEYLQKPLWLEMPQSWREDWIYCPSTLVQNYAL